MSPFRERIVTRLFEDLIGPLSPAEILEDRPSQRYSTAILYPQGSRIEPSEDEDGGQVVNESEDAASLPDSGGVRLHTTTKPSTAGLSFAILPTGENVSSTIHIKVMCAVYKRFGVDDSGGITEDHIDRAHERWRRVPLETSLQVQLSTSAIQIPLDDYGIVGMELYVLGKRYGGLVTVTAAVSNKQSRGRTSAFDEERHFFQVELSVHKVLNGAFAPRPSRRAITDDDSRTAALIYRDVEEYVVGHTCSARADIRDKSVISVATDWLPRVVVSSISDRGDEVFEDIHSGVERLPLHAKWLSEASPTHLVLGLKDLVEAYRKWIQGEDNRITGLPATLRPQAHLHIERCRQGAERMLEGVAAIENDPTVSRAFQLAQAAMSLQFGWARGRAALVWRPFQLAFQLLVLPSLAARSHKDRDTMDLLWFPTGGGKTEAYLALSAFVILLRRLRRSRDDGGGGVAVLMRYTLRLLTVQQFQRAAAMIVACELIRRRSRVDGGSLPDLGDTPIGIGLWVGAAATPLTLKDALNRSDSDPSTPEQITTCPCCGEKLNWKLTPKESFVECSSEGSKCEVAETGTRLPIWTIDEEIYNHTPSLLIGTIDKFAQIVRKLETRSLFGRSAGFFPPDLIIQDELHLISGPLGSIAGLYEVAIDELCRRGNIRPKIIGSTATIRRAEDQIRALFDRGTYQFPSPGLDSVNSGFAVTDLKSPGRLYVGLTTAGRSATYMLQALVASLLQGAAESGSTPEERNHYWTLVIYFNSLRELGRALVLVQDDVPVSIRQFAGRRGEPPRRIEVPAELTSRVRSYEIRDMLKRLEKPSGDPEVVDLLVASNMISVGMDIPRLGLMVVNAQPKTLSEYIQATSRVGRGSVPGLVITMYNNTRARDRSHFETFETWHRSLYRDVEATSVTPFASRAQDKALHAVLVALVRHTIPGMERRPLLSDLRRPAVEQISALIESRVASVDPAESGIVSQKLKRLIDEWAGRPDLQTYWDDYDRKTSLLMSAEQFAAMADVDSDLDPEGARRALWPTPNSMREVEPGVPFILRYLLKTEVS